MSGARIRIGIVGCGRISERHFTAVEKNKDFFELVSVCDQNFDRTHRWSKELGVKAYSSYEEMLKNERLDLVSICTPSGLHAEQAILAAQHGLHVVTEKPMATRFRDGQRMVETCDRHKVKLFVVKQNRLNPTLQLLKRSIDLDRFGRIFYVTSNVFWTRPQSYYDSDPWRGTWEFDGGALMNQASHYVDLLEWLIGPVESVQSQTGTLARKIEVDDTAAVIMKWRGGAIGTINVSMLTYKQNFEGSITILGEFGTVRLGGIALNRVEVWNFEKPSADDDLVSAASYATESVYGHSHLTYYQNVAKVLQGLERPIADGREGLRSLELLIASYLSSRSGKRISLPLDY